MTYWATLWWLIVGHAICDYPLQGDFLARAKNHTRPIPDVPWWICLAAHSMIHGGAVALITGSVLLGAMEALLHALFDHVKCAGGITFEQDQVFHILTKVAFAGLAPFAKQAGI